MLHFAVIRDNLGYLCFGSFPAGGLGGLALSLVLTAVTLICSTVLGFAAALGLVFGGKGLRFALSAPIALLRAAPIMLLIFWFYFGLPLLLGSAPPPLLAVLCALSAVGGAYIARIAEGGLQALPTGQAQAAAALGLRRGQIIRAILFPQLIANILPSLSNQWVSLLKDTSLGYIIGVQEFLYVARQTDGRDSGAYSLTIYLFIGCVYFVLCFGLNSAAQAAARRLKTAPQNR